MQKLKNCDYYIGLDMGDASVGWAVTDTNYNILKFNGKALWGIRLFDSANTAASTRVFRSGRRRIDRTTWRLKMLQELFAEEIAMVDENPAMHRISLGRRILRTETAGIVMASNILYELED